MIDEHTWRTLTAGQNLQVIDATDVSTPGELHGCFAEIDLCLPWRMRQK